MPLSSTFEHHRFLERALRIRRRPVTAYGLAVAAVAGATALRWVLGGYVMPGLPFITLFPAIIIVAVLGGLGPGIVATLLSAVIAWYAFLTPPTSFALDPVQFESLLLFLLAAAINLAVVALLNAGLDRILAQEQNLRILVDSSPNGIIVVDDHGRIKLVNPAAERLFGYDKSELLGQRVELLVPDRQAEPHRILRTAFQRQPEARAMGAGRDLTGRRKDGSEFPLEIGLNPVSRNGNRAVLATVIDISERKRAQDRQQFLIGELKHRTQNLFSILQSVARLSLVEGRTIAEAREMLGGRLRALARTHAMLADAAWQGAPLAEILEREFAAFSEHLSVSGCDIVINTPAAQQFALIVHELATNAVKYGALSAPAGRVAVEGRVERFNGDSQFLFRWVESGGPPVSSPARRGFGTAILLDAAKQFGANVALDYAQDGLRYELRLALQAIEPSPQPIGSEASDPPAVTALR